MHFVGHGIPTILAWDKFLLIFCGIIFLSWLSLFSPYVFKGGVFLFGLNSSFQSMLFSWYYVMFLDKRRNLTQINACYLEKSFVFCFYSFPYFLIGICCLQVLICRLIDRPLRPTMPKGFYHETQILSWVRS